MDLGRLRLNLQHWQCLNINSHGPSISSLKWHQVSPNLWSSRNPRSWFLIPRLCFIMVYEFTGVLRHGVRSSDSLSEFATHNVVDSCFVSHANTNLLYLKQLLVDPLYNLRILTMWLSTDPSLWIHVKYEIRSAHANVSTFHTLCSTAHLEWMWGIFCKILLVPLNVVMDLNNVMHVTITKCVLF